MKKIKHIFFGLLIFSSFYANSQTRLEGYWQGKVYYSGNSSDKGSIIFLHISKSGEVLSGKVRHEEYGTENMSLRKINISMKGNTYSIAESGIEKKSSPPGYRWCTKTYEVTYNDSTGYLSGNFLSKECRGGSGNVILFRSTATWSEEKSVMLNHSWLDRFNLDLQKKYNAPEIREIERKNFVFEPIYFDYDKADIRPEYVDFLKRIVRVVDGHSDLRIRVTGHTDADGSDAYNIDLSKRRAQALIDFFVSQGLKPSRIEIDFKGESLPVDSNKTSQGKQKNRRVDFQFV
jgi:OOP family OmpA-OmpF porin